MFQFSEKVKFSFYRTTYSLFDVWFDDMKLLSCAEASQFLEGKSLRKKETEKHNTLKQKHKKVEKRNIKGGKEKLKHCLACSALFVFFAYLSKHPSAPSLIHTVKSKYQNREMRKKFTFWVNPVFKYISFPNFYKSFISQMI